MISLLNFITLRYWDSSVHSTNMDRPIRESGLQLISWCWVETKEGKRDWEDCLARNKHQRFREAMGTKGKERPVATTLALTVTFKMVMRRRWLDQEQPLEMALQRLRARSANQPISQDLELIVWTQKTQRRARPRYMMSIYRQRKTRMEKEIQDRARIRKIPTLEQSQAPKAALVVEWRMVTHEVSAQLVHLVLQQTHQVVSIWRLSFLKGTQTPNIRHK